MKKSAQRKAYYAGPGNKFWSTLHRIGLTPIRLEPEEYKKVLNYGIGLTDLVKGVAGRDDKLPKASFDTAALIEKILKFRPQVLCFNGKKAAQVFMDKKKVDYGLQDLKVGETIVFVAPSTSGAASGY